jgi:hypothetical protein
VIFYHDMNAFAFLFLNIIQYLILSAYWRSKGVSDREYKDIIISIILSKSWEERLCEFWLDELWEINIFFNDSDCNGRF